jgi:hypothetical protein
VGEDVVWLALEQLGSIDLLEAPVVRVDGLSRAQLVKRASLVAAAIALPVTASLAVPTAAKAAVSCAGGCGKACTSSTDCANCPAGCQTCAASTCSQP